MAHNPDCINCTICGVFLGGAEDWKADAVALAGPHWPDLSRSPPHLRVANNEVARYAAKATSNRGSLVILPKGRKVCPQSAYDVKEQSDNPLDRAGTMYVGIHAACEDLANRVMRTSLSAKVNSIGDLWFTIERRCARVIHQDPCKAGMHFTPPIPNSESGQPFSVGFGRYYIPSHNIYRYGDHWDGWWDEDPVAIPDLSILLIQNLAPAGDAVHRLPNNFNKYRKHVESLPQEVKDLICSFLAQAPLHLEFNYIMPQSMWRQVLLQVSFLWDLDAQAVHDKAVSRDSESQQWDWEKITRQIMSPAEISPSEAFEDDEGIWGFDKVGLSVPDGFTNRRRIWQILEEMYPNDVGL